MVQISKRKVPERISLILFQLLFEVMGKKFREYEFANILNDLFSETEKIMLINLKSSAHVSAGGVSGS